MFDHGLINYSCNNKFLMESITPSPCIMRLERFGVLDINNRTGDTVTSYTYVASFGVET